MAKHNSRVMALPLGLRLGDFEWDETAKKPVGKNDPRTAKQKSDWKNARSRRRRRDNKRIAKHCQQIALIVAADRLEQLAEENEQAITRWREQQTREAKAYAQRLAAGFHEAVKKAAIGDGC